MLEQPNGGYRMAVPAEKVTQLIHWLKLRRLAFRFDHKTKVICFAGFIVPGLPAIDSPGWLYLAALIGVVVLAVAPVLIGKSVAKEIEHRFGKAVLERALHHCTLGRYLRNKTFTIGDIQAQLEAERQAQYAGAANDA